MEDGRDLVERQGQLIVGSGEKIGLVFPLRASSITSPRHARSSKAAKPRLLLPRDGTSSIGPMTRYLIPTALVSVAVATFAAVGLLTPSSLGWTAPAPAWVNVALVVLLGLPVVWLLAFSHHLKSRWALSEANPVDMYAHVEVEDDSESTDYYVCLRVAPAEAVLHRLPVQRPRGSIAELHTPQAAKVFIDRRTGKPIVVELPGRRLWTMPS